MKAKLNALEIDADKRVYVWVEDEHRYGLISTIRRCWTLIGHRVKVPVQMKYQWGYVYGSVEITTGKTLFIYSPTVSLPVSQIFLQQIAQTDPHGIHIVIWDNAGFHQKSDVNEIPQQIRLLPLPPYCPELNPIEKLWDIVIDHVSNEVYETLDSIEEQISVVLRPFWSCTQRVIDWLGDNWLTRSVADFINERNGSEVSILSS